jgi:hypothetical protein
MKYKTLFRLLLKFLGVWFGANALVSLTHLIGTALNEFREPSGMSIIYRTLITSFAATVMQTAIAVYLFRGAKWVVDKAIPSNRLYCHECGYDLTGAQGDICSECGTVQGRPA